MARRELPPFVYPLGTAGAVYAGADEAGRGPLAGNVVAAAVILDPRDPIAGLADSKTLTPRKRELLYAEIGARALAVGVGRASPAEIDAINILRASLLAMERAVAALAARPDMVLVDGPHAPAGLPVPALAVVRGDARVPEIAAASIVAKVTRDREMDELDALHPLYGFAAHRGYPTARHLEALRRHGVIRGLYRETYAPVREILAGGGRG